MKEQGKKLLNVKGKNVKYEKVGTIKFPFSVW